MSIVGATKANGLDSRSKAYQVKDDFYPGSKADRRESRKFVDLMRACNGHAWTPELEDAVLKGCKGDIRALLTLPNPKKVDLDAS